MRSQHDEVDVSVSRVIDDRPGRCSAENRCLHRPDVCVPCAVYDGDDLDLPESELGLDGSFTEVTSLESRAGPERRQEWIDGPVEEQAAEVASVLEETI